MTAEAAPPDPSTGEDAALRCGFVALIGAPNAGKSTLLNELIGAKVSIVTHKVQTTRTRIRGIAIEGESQIVFVDTPGIFEAKRRLERAMVAAAWNAVQEADALVLLYDAARKRIDADTERVIARLKDWGLEAVLVLNKIDLIKREKLLELAARFEAEGIFARIFMISSLKGEGVADLRRYLAETLPEGPWHYPEDQLSDLPQRLIAAEVTREKLFLKLHQELPYALTVENERWQPFDDGSLRLEQTIYVQRDSQKGIVLGKGGRTIKALRSEAQADLEEMLGCKVHLFLFVKVRENWIDDPARYREWGLDFQA
ncbi:MAG: GTPase Era [Kiloniellales bacterium]|nr:GTPase Era [Kiloniellales bacterium]